MDRGLAASAWELAITLECPPLPVPGLRIQPASSRNSCLPSAQRHEAHEDCHRRANNTAPVTQSITLLIVQGILSELGLIVISRLRL
jgi:hypothetical protein